MKVVFISTLRPSGHFSQYITNGLNSIKEIYLLVYSDKNPENSKLKTNGEIKNVFSKSPNYIWQILVQLYKDKPDLVHIQQEFNMYGGPITVIIFPLLVFLIRILGIKVVVTIHASVYKSQIDRNFVEMFHQNSRVVKPLFLKLFFNYIFLFSSIFADKILVHTNLSKKILKDYGVKPEKVDVIKTPIPKKQTFKYRKKKYFFYFGYMVRRKGIENLLVGFHKFMKNNPKSKFRLLMAGGVIKGQEQALAEIKSLIKKYQLQKRVLILGFIEEKQQDKLYGESYAVTIPGIVSFGSSGPLYHALSYHKCVIASAVGHFLEDISDGKTGILTKNDSWHNAFTLAANNPKKISKIETNIARIASERTPMKTALKYFSLYKKIYEK